MVLWVESEPVWRQDCGAMNSQNALVSFATITLDFCANYGNI